MKRFTAIVSALLLLLPLLLLSLSSSRGAAQLWSGILAPARADANWPNAGATIPSGSIPACATQPASYTPSGIAAAFNANAGGASYCLLNVPAGTYSMNASLIFQYAGKANVILNGAGANQTFMVWNSAPTTNCVGFGPVPFCIWNGDSSINAGTIRMGNHASVTGGLSQGSNSLTLSSFSNLKVGSEIQIFQNDAASDNGNAWFCQTAGVTGDCSQQGGAQAPNGATETQMVTITACGTSTFGASCGSGSVTINPAIKASNWSLSLSPVAYWSSSLPATNIGVQNLSFDISSLSGISDLFFFQCVQCANVWWLQNRTINGTVSGSAAVIHINFVASNHTTVMSSYMYGSNPASEGYGVDFESGTADSLAINNIGQHIATSYITETGVGNVFAYNYAVDNYFGSGWQQCDELHHAGGDYYNLWEGNVGICAGGDDVHGTHFANTWYRDYLSGFDPATDGGSFRYANLQAFTDMAYSRYDNVVASVLGTPAETTTYQIAGAAGSPFNCSSAATGNIFQFGYGDQNNRPFNAYPGPPNVPAGCGDTPGTNWYLDNDPLVAATTMRWGNWDTVSGAVRENSSETASTAPTYPGLSAPSTTFPCSFYFSSCTPPAWWQFPHGTASPFPGIGPDVTGGGIGNTGGHAGDNPASNCGKNVLGINPSGSSGPLQFNPAACYISSTPTAAAPTFSPVSPYAGGATTVTITDTTPAASLTYCTSNSGPCAPTVPYTSGIAFTSSGPANICAFATASGFLQSPTACWTGTFTTPTLAPPTLSPLASSSPYFLSGAAPSITATTAAGASIFYTLDGTTPTCSSTLYSAPVPITASGQNFQAVACQSGFTTSTVAATGAFTQTAIILDSAANNLGGGPGGVNPITCGPLTPSTTGELLTVEVVYGSAQTVNNVTDTVNPGQYSSCFTPAMHANPNNGIQGGCFNFSNPHAGVATTINVNLTGTTGHASASCQVWKTSASGAFVLDPTATQQQDGTGANPTTGSAVTPANPNTLILSDAYTCTQTPTPGSGYFALTSNPGPNLFTQYQVQTTVTATNAPWVMAADTTGASCNAGWTDQQAAFYVAATTTFSFTATTAGAGSGTISCSPTPPGNYPSGTAISCTASAATGSGFTGWSGTGSAAGCSGTAGCAFSLTANSAVTATFAANPAAAAPTFSPVAGGYGSGQTVTASTTTSACNTASFLFTGTTNPPATAGNTISVPSSRTIYSYVHACPGYQDSTVTTGTYTINGQAVAPTFSPAAGSYGPTQSVTIASVTAGATLCYTTDGSTPTANGAGTCTHGSTYSGAVPVSATETLKAVASEAGWNDSAVASAAYTINGAVATPTFSPVAGTYTTVQTVTLSTATAGAALCYTLNGATPAATSPGTCDAGSATYTSAITIPVTTTVKTLGTQAGYANSAVASATYTINPGPPTGLSGVVVQ